MQKWCILFTTKNLRSSSVFIDGIKAKIGAKMQEARHELRAYGIISSHHGSSPTSAIGVRCPLFADDIKMFSSPVLSPVEDCHRLQDCLNDIEEWYTINQMKFNDDKCQVLTFHRLARTILFEYSLNGTALKHVHSIRDLEF